MKMEQTNTEDRRAFIQKMSAGLGLMAFGRFPFDVLGESVIKVTILHTNDVHSRIEPFPENSGRLTGKGGAARRAAYIKKVREFEPHVLLLDAGDIWQGTPYFNVFNGRLEFELMSQMKYDAATLGNHDFDLGLEGLLEQWDKAKFPFVCSNYDFSDTPMNGKTIPYQIFEFNGVKIGLIGLGIELNGLVPKLLYGNTRYLDPVERTNYWSRYLKKEKDCDFVIVLSHLGLAYENLGQISDERLVPQTKYIDLVIGGHTHTFLPKPHMVRNAKGRQVAVNQVGYGGAMIGRIDLYFDTEKKKRTTSCQNCWL